MACNHLMRLTRWAPVLLAGVLTTAACSSSLLIADLQSPLSAGAACASANSFTFFVAAEGEGDDNLDGRSPATGFYSLRRAQVALLSLPGTDPITQTTVGLLPGRHVLTEPLSLTGRGRAPSRRRVAAR